MSQTQQTEEGRPKTLQQALQILKRPTPPEFVKTREGWRDRNGNTHMVEYVEWHYVTDLLDNTWPLWEFKIDSTHWDGEVATVIATITLISETGNRISRSGLGTGSPKGDNLQGKETAYKAAESDALKRAATKFGVARDLYQHDAPVQGQGGGGRGQGPDFPRDPLAKSMADLVTPKQLGMIRALAREAGVDMDEECQQVMRVRTEELSKRAASSFIDHLKGLQARPAGRGGQEEEDDETVF